MKRIFFIIIGALLLWGCEKTIEFDGEMTKPYIVMISQPEADSVWMVDLSYSRFFLLSQEIKTIDDATVTMEVNGSIVSGSAQSLGDGLYNTHIVPQSGDTLTLRARVGDEEVVAGCRMPFSPTITDFHAEYDTSYYENWDGSSTYAECTPRYHFKLHDKAGEKNYYRIRMFIKYDDCEDCEIENLNFSIEDPLIYDEDVVEVILNEGENYFYGRSLMFSDERIDGTTHNIAIDNISQSFLTRSNNTVIIEVSALSRELYLYLSSLEAAENGDDLGFFSEPVQIICNVNGGIGVLGGMSTTTLTDKL